MKVKQIGLEVEGGWGGERGVPPFDIPLIADHSVDGRTLPTDKELTTAHVGEIVSAPMDPDMRIIGPWIDKYWPDDANRTCGYHIHLSFRRIKDYCLLTRKSFLYSLRKDMLDLGKELGLPDTHYLFARLNGANPFATINFDASRQILLNHKAVGDRTRYGFINCCWGLHKTIEFRALPTFETKDLAKKFTKRYLEFVESYLNEHANESIEYSVTMKSESGNFVVETK